MSLIIELSKGLFIASGNSFQKLKILTYQQPFTHISVKLREMGSKNEALPSV
jgi:hypothetical protein